MSSGTTTSPNKPVVVYDGECPFCIEHIERFKSQDSDDQFEFVPRQQPGLEERFPVLSSSDFNTGMRFIGTDGKVEVGADAIYQICRRLPSYRTFTWLYTLPIFKQIVQLGYSWVAANRKRLGKTCDSGTCKISDHTGE